MKKHLVVIGIAILLICVGLAVGFSGCIEENKKQDDTSKFIGTWILVENSFGMDNHTKDTWIFYENKSAKSTIIHFKKYPEEPNASINIKWVPFEAKEDRLYITPQDNYTIWYNYLFSNNDIQLTLSISGFSTQKYNKTES